ncbi:MAG: photosynthetic complex assembly protein PuhC [Pseudomonadota bacterium]
MSEHEPTSFSGHHRWPLIGALCVIVFTVGIVAMSVATQRGQVHGSVGETRDERMITFRMEEAGAFSVIDANSEEAIGHYDVGEGAFIRSSIRSLSLNRTAQGVDYTLPYRLVRAVNGHVSLVDPHTGHFIKLNSFGPVAVNSFTPFLPDPSGTGA